jgi:hypothetical protein
MPFAKFDDLPNHIKMWLQETGQPERVREDPPRRFILQPSAFIPSPPRPTHPKTLAPPHLRRYPERIIPA